MVPPSVSGRVLGPINANTVNDIRTSGGKCVPCFRSYEFQKKIIEAITSTDLSKQVESPWVIVAVAVVSRSI